MALLIDTGVLLRAFDRADPDRAKIWLALRPTLRSSARPRTAMQNVAEFWNVSTRPAAARGGMGHSAGRVALRVMAIERYCEVVTETRTHTKFGATWSRRTASPVLPFMTPGLSPSCSIVGSPTFSQ